MRRISIRSALGCSILILLISACAPKEQIKPIEISLKPVAKPELVLPGVDEVNLRTLTWIIITEDNYKEVFTSLKNANGEAVLFGLKGSDYENLALNISDLRALIEQQKSVIAAYNSYYIKSNSALTEANKRLAG